MLFGRSVFESVLTRLHEEAPPVEDPAEEEPALRIRGLTSGLAFEQPRAGTESGRRLDEDYLDNLFEPALRPASGPDPERAPDPPAPEEPPVPPHLTRLTEKDVAEDLAIGPGDDLKSLAEKRRRFARDNHPDRVPPALREAANQRMRLANRQIDAAMRRLRR